MLHSSVFVEQLKQYGEDKIFFHHEGNSFTAGQILSEAITIASALEIKGFKEGDRVVLIIPPGKNFLSLIYALILLRGKAALIDPEMGQQNFNAKLNQFAPQWTFADSRLLLLQEHPIIRFLYLKFALHPVYFTPLNNTKVIACGKRMPLVRRFLKYADLSQPKKNTTLPLSKKNDDDEFLITYTSGTLDEPKGVVHSLSSLSRAVSAIKNILGNPQGQAIGAYLPHFVLMGIASGIPVYLYDKKWTAQQKISYIKIHNISILFGPPSDYLPLMEFCEKQGQKLPVFLQHIILGSAPVHASFLEKLYEYAPEDCRITCLYGMTENLLVCSIDGREKINYKGEGDLVGYPLAGTDLRISADGEIELKSGMLFTRYFHQSNRPEWHATGDLGMLTENNLLVLKGRKKEMIIRRDTNIYPALYEKTIKYIKGVDEAVMIGIYNEEKKDEEVILVVEGSGLTEEKLMNELRKGKYNIDKEALPDRIMFMPIPRGGRQNKINRKALTELVKTML